MLAWLARPENTYYGIVYPVMSHAENQIKEITHAREAVNAMSYM